MSEKLNLKNVTRKLQKKSKFPKEKKDPSKLQVLKDPKLMKKPWIPPLIPIFQIPSIEQSFTSQPQLQPSTNPTESSIQQSGYQNNSN
jgi:hypothetical protein